MHHWNLAGLISAFCVYEIEWLSARYGMRRQELESLRKLVRGPLRIGRGDTLYRQGDGAGSIYSVASGSFKSLTTDADGREAVADLHFEGDFMGLEALAEMPRSFTAEALTESRVFRLDAAELRKELGRIPGLETELLRLMSQAVWKSEQHRLLLHRQVASARLAAFLLYLSECEQRNGRDPGSLHLPMSRGDLAGFLGLATETLSRLLGRFASRNLIRVRGRRIRLTGLQEISRLAGKRYLIPVLCIVLAQPLLFA